MASFDQPHSRIEKYLLRYGLGQLTSSNKVLKKTQHFALEKIYKLILPIKQVNNTT